MKTPSLKHVLHIGYHPAFHDFIDFENHRVSLIVHPFILGLMSPGQRQQFASIGALQVPHNMNLDEYDDAYDQIVSLADSLAEQTGPFDAIVGLFEHVTLPAAKLRERYQLGGTRPEAALLCRDKVEMKRALQKNGVRVPKFIDASSVRAAVDTFISGLPGKIVLKPKSQAASEGVKVFRDAKAALDFIAREGLDPQCEIEEFIEGKILHCDGVVRSNELRFFSASEYLNTCFDFVYGDKALCSVTIDDKKLLRECKDFTSHVLKGLGLRDGVFHLELFLTPADELVFLEIGNRFGGAGVSPLINKVYGVNIIKEAVKAECGEDSLIDDSFDIGDRASAAWLYMPLPTKKPGTLRGIRGLETLPNSIFYSELPNLGQRFNDHAMPFPSAGKFFVRAPSSDEVKADCAAIIATYQVNIECDG
jgi:biotin carboxylase